jgi:hypothetical protein
LLDTETVLRGRHHVRWVIIPLRLIGPSPPTTPTSPFSWADEKEVLRPEPEE